MSGSGLFPSRGYRPPSQGRPAPQEAVSGPAQGPVDGWSVAGLSPAARALAQEIGRQSHVYDAQGEWQLGQTKVWLFLMACHLVVLLGWVPPIIDFLVELDRGSTELLYVVFAAFGIFYVPAAIFIRWSYLASWMWAGILWLVFRFWWNVVHISRQPPWLQLIAIATFCAVGLIGAGVTFVRRIAPQAAKDFERFH
jgi:hypothetical protein